MSNLEQTRQQAIRELDTVSEKQRFGYFSIPATLAIGDSRFAGKTIQKDEFGRVATQPRNISVKPTAEGHTKSSYFSLERSIYDGDPYMDPGKLDRTQKLKEQREQPEGKQVYKPATGVTKSLMSASFPHLPSEITETNPKAHRNAEGGVITQPPNITCSPSSKIAKKYFKPPSYESSPYDAQHQLKLKQIEAVKNKLPEAGFKPLGPGGKNFSSNRAAYGCDIELPAKKQRTYDIQVAQHDSNFRPSNPTKSGVLATIGKFPEYKENPPKQTKRQCPADDKREAFKLRSPQKLTVPCPSVTLNPVNLRRCLR